MTKTRDHLPLRVLKLLLLTLWLLQALEWMKGNCLVLYPLNHVFRGDVSYYFCVGMTHRTYTIPQDLPKQLPPIYEAKNAISSCHASLPSSVDSALSSFTVH